MTSTVKLHSSSEPRVINPNSSADKQAEVLEALINNPPSNSRIITITPSLAKYVMLNLNPNNRPKKTRDITRFAVDMAAGKWAVTGDTIKFGKSGILRDGQHRLAACVRANKNFDTHVVFGVDDRSFTVMDIGRVRKGTDAFAVEGIKDAALAAGATRWVLIFGSGRPDDRAMSFTNTELLTAYKAFDTARLQAAMLEARAIWSKHRCLPPSSMAAFLYIAQAENPVATTAFVDDLKNKRGKAKTMLKAIQDIIDYGLGRIHENQRHALMILTWDAYVTKGPLSVKTLKAWNPTKPFPDFI